MVLIIRDFMTLSVKRFSELTNDELYAVLKLRVDVFVVEQKCAYPDLDGKDPDALHVFLSDEDGIAAYLRVLPEGCAAREIDMAGVLPQPLAGDHAARERVAVAVKAAHHASSRRVTASR